MELETHAVISHGLGYYDDTRMTELQQRIEEIGRMLNGLIQALKKSHAAVAASP